MPDPATTLEERRTGRIGLALFIVYCLLYGGFIALSTFSPKTMALRPFGGANLAIIYGFGLIVAALALACVYMVSCRTRTRP